MSFNLDDFIAKPTVAKLNACTKDDLLEVAVHYGVKIAPSLRKQQQIQELIEALIVKEVFEPSARDLPGKEEITGELDFSNQLALRKLELEFEYKKMEREFDLKEREAERAEQARAREREHELEIRRIGGGVRPEQHEARFDVTKHIRLVPQFLEKDVDKYFSMFENVATTLRWPDDH